MLFGWSVGDVVAGAQLAWHLYKALNDASGAPEHQRKSAARLKQIQFRLRILAKVIGDHDGGGALIETEENALLAEVDVDDVRSVVVHLKAGVQGLEALVSKGPDMQPAPNQPKRLRD
ncbi:hypothetical protein QQX98_011688 [Neonectria punicea]|uniref:Prion-inhibition and propagation HeLo domain-containing protein n=1 Tax=Neonectria punicea TaxID=979145 RepID=A0ABR1GKZ1_9HYPO